MSAKFLHGRHICVALYPKESVVVAIYVLFARHGSGSFPEKGLEKLPDKQCAERVLDAIEVLPLPFPLIPPKGFSFCKEIAH